MPRNRLDGVFGRDSETTIAASDGKTSVCYNLGIVDKYSEMPRNRPDGTLGEDTAENSTT